MIKIVARFSMVIALLLAATNAKAQDPHFAGVQEMNTWYNPALKTNKLPQAHLSFRSVNYPGITSYTSKAATIELPLIGRDKDATDNIFFMNLTAGISTDNSGDKFMNASTAMLALSYALPLNDDNTCLALGFQGNYSFNRFGTGNTYYYPAGFDKFGAFASSMANDPLQSGYSFGYFTVGVGAAVFHTGEQKQWYIGGAIRHFNHPYTEWSHSVRLSANDGIQAGYTTAISSVDAIGGYGNFSWQAGLQELIIGALYTRKFSDGGDSGDNSDSTGNNSTNNSVYFGLAYRAGDAVIPNAGLVFGKNQFSFFYEINLSTTTSGPVTRHVFEFSYRRNL